MHDGDFLPDPTCFPDIKALSDNIRTAINATTVFSFWPEVLKNSNEFGVLQKEGCLINSDLGGLAIDPTTDKCRDYIWTNFLKPRYVHPLRDPSPSRRTPSTLAACLA